MQEPVTRYARSGDVSIAYQVTGEGPFDLVWVTGFVSSVELFWQVPRQAELFRRLGSFCRLIRFDKRGTGMSDRVEIGDLETRMDDVRAVMDAVGIERAALLGSSEGGPMSLLFAATYPERVWALALWGTFPRIRWAPDYPQGDSDEALAEELENDIAAWTDPARSEDLAAAIAPGLDDESRRAFARALRQSASPGGVRGLHSMCTAIDVRHVLPAISVPTLVMCRSGDAPTNVGGSRYLAEHVSGARYVEFPGEAHALFAGDYAGPVAELERFLGDAWAAAQEEAEPERVLATLLFTDIVGSTDRAAQAGDRAWRELLERHHALVRRELTRFRGVELDTAGDGFFARFDGPARAIHCAESVTRGVRELGIEVRAGLHTGECELFERKVGGIAVSIASRVCGEAGPGEVIVSGTVKDLVAGSGLEFLDRGVRELKGVPGEWRLFAVRG